MRIAIPCSGGQLAGHFGHCETFSLFDVDPVARTITAEESLVAPSHEPGLLPAWLKEKNATVIIAGGMGSRAHQLFDQAGIAVVVGATPAAPRAVAEAWLSDSLQTGTNLCDH